MSDKSVSEKMRIKPGSAVSLLRAPDGFAALLELPTTVTLTESPADADVIVLVVNVQADVEAHLPAMKPELERGAALWVVYRKGSKAAGLDVSRDTIWAFAEPLGFRPVGLVSVDERWSGFRFSIPA